MRGKLNQCRGSGAGSFPLPQGGARWTAKFPCPFCGKTVRLTKSGHLRAHGTQKKECPECQTDPCACEEQMDLEIALSEEDA